MKQKKIQKRLKALTASRQPGRFALCFDECNRLLFPLQCSDGILIAAEENDFRVDGYRLIPYHKIQRIKPAFPLVEKIVQCQGLADTIEAPAIDLTSWQFAFQCIQEQNRHVIIECGYDWLFTIGQIRKAKKHKVLVWYYDANGVWEEQPREIYYKDINIVSFGDRYSQTYQNYVGEPPQPQKKGE